MSSIAQVGFAFFLFAAAVVPRLSAQSGAAMPISTNMPMPMPAGMPMPAAVSANPFPGAEDSGTSAQPASTPEPMLMFTRGSWTFMVHGLGFLTLQEQTGPRGADKLFSTNWLMGMAARPWGPGTLTLRSMLSLEPVTITDRQFPELFQTGETAYGLPIVDGQHPHNFFMELAALYSLPLDEHAGLSIYAAPMGDPAIGPTAYPHRASAAEDPLAPLGHHLEDSTHVSADVLTLGASYRAVRLEGSAFHGREPDENRWAIQYGTIDSYSTRLTVDPAPNWSGQFSVAHIASPEALAPAVNQLRDTASIMYNRPLAGGNLANSVVWGRTRDLGGRNILNGYLLESNLAFRVRNHLWTRIENVDKTNELLLGENPWPAGFVETFLARIQAYSFGYDRELPAPAWLSAALGAQWTLYQAPGALLADYGAHPQGVAVFLRIHLGAR